MATFHSRSNSFPSQSSPVIDDVQDQLCRLKSSQTTSTSTSPNSICTNLASLRDLHQGIQNLIQMPSIQQLLSKEEGQIWMNELLEGSVKLMDLCGFSRDVASQMKEAVQELGSSIRRGRGETDTDHHFNAYMASKKKMIKMVKKSIKSLKSSTQNAAAVPDIGNVLKEAESLDFSITKSVLILLCGEKERSSQRSWSFLSKKDHVDHDSCFLNIHRWRGSMDTNNLLKQLQSSEMMIQELEEGMESLFRDLLKTRVSLLNVLSH